MSTCLQSIESIGLPGISEIVPNTNLPFFIAQGTNALFKMTVPFVQSKTFNIFLSQISGSGVNISVSIFRVTASINSVGSVNITSLTSSFVRDFAAGVYIICIRTNNTSTFNGFINESAVGFPGSAVLNINHFAGQNCSLNLEVPKPPRICNEPLYFEITEGELPPGITMTSLGRLQGKLPDLDCIDGDFSPSFNWLYENEGSYYPWARQWRFKVKVQVADNTSVTAEEWFCIRVVNDWSKDRDNFLRQMPFLKTQLVEIIEPPKILPKTLCVEKCAPPPQVERAITSSLCDSCEPVATYEISPNKIDDSRTLIGGRNSNDIDFLLLSWMSIENQKNPITAEGFNGSKIKVELT